VSTSTLGLIAIAFIVIKLQKRLPLNFAVNLCFYAVAMIFRMANVIVFNKRDPIRVIIGGICVGLIELSL
jgi:predicted membrane protein